MQAGAEQENAMTRARKLNTPVNDGMNLLQVMPFPAFNPWNWWALAAPQNAWRASLHTTQLVLQMWRVSADGMRALVREQQDAMLAMAREPLTATAEAEIEAPAEAADEIEAQAADFVTPMLDVTRAYGRAGKAFIVAQRNTMRAFAGAAKPH
jgi:hypothetical protein